MLDLAGFDMILQIPRQGIERELRNQPLAYGPDGTPDTLVPPFVLMRSTPLPGFTGQVRVVVRELIFEAVPRTALTRLSMRFDEGSLEAPGLALGMMGGAFSLTVPALFTGPQPQPPVNGRQRPPVSRLALDFGAAQSSFGLDAPTLDALNNQVGASMAQIILNAMQTAMVGLFRARGLLVTGISVQVDTSRPSSQFMTVTDVPRIMWIDGDSLGVFGQHRVPAVGGDPAWKAASDLPPAPYASYPWYPVAGLLSPQSFQQIIVCPGLRNAVRELVASDKRDQYINEEKAKNSNQGKATPAEKAAAEVRLIAYLDSPDGQAEIDANTPPTCGSGKITRKKTVDVPLIPTFDAVVSITRVQVDLGEGRLNLLASAEAHVLGTTLKVTLPMWVEPTLNVYTQQIEIGTINKGEPQTIVDFGIVPEAAAAVLFSYISGPLLGTLGAVLFFSLAESMAESLVNYLINERSFPGVNQGFDTQSNARLRWQKLVIDPSGLMLQGTWEGLVNDPHKFEPVVRLARIARAEPSATILNDRGEFRAHCMIGDGVFNYTRCAWDTTLALSIETQDVPLPLNYGEWWLWIDQTPFKLDVGTITAAGNVVILEPPNNERSEYRSDITVQVDGSNETGWVLHFRGEDAVVFYRLETSVTDGSGRRYALWTNYERIQGQTLEIDPNYWPFFDRCGEAIVGVGEGYELVQDVPFWEQVMNGEAVIRQQLQQAARGRSDGAARRLEEILANRPELVAGLFRVME